MMQSNYRRMQKHLFVLQVELIDVIRVVKVTDF